MHHDDEDDTPSITRWLLAHAAEKGWLAAGLAGLGAAANYLLDLFLLIAR